jgi:hypothetical protein
LKTNCPKCGEEIEINIGKLMGPIKTEKKSTASRENGKKGGRPVGSKDTAARKTGRREPPKTFEEQLNRQKKTALQSDI